MGPYPLYSHPIGTKYLAGRIIRPANWAFNKNLSKSDVRTFGAFYIGREVSQTDSFAQKRGKGQQDVLFGALYRGAVAHISYKAGGNETAQLSVADAALQPRQRSTRLPIANILD